ncbi:unnamed protein product, partial [Dovyalis caffra]
MAPSDQSTTELTELKPTRTRFPYLRVKAILVSLSPGGPFYYVRNWYPALFNYEEQAAGMSSHP